MKSIMEENKIVQTLSILLYSRSYQILYLEIFDTDTKNLISKQYINTSQHVELNLGMPLKKVEIMVKKNEQSMQILNEFKFCLQDFSSNSTVQKMENYIKLKKRSDQYSLLFQIFYQLRLSFNSTNELGNKDQEEILRISEEEKKKQIANQLKEIAKSNLFLLGYRVVNNFQKNNPSKKKISLPSEQSFGDANSRSRCRKTKKTYTFNARMQKLRKEEFKKDNFYLTYDNYHDQIKSQKQVIKEQNDESDSFCWNEGVNPNQATSFTNNSRVFVMRKQKKNLSYESSKNHQMKRALRKKITFLDEKVSIKPDDDDTELQNSLIGQKPQTFQKLPFAILKPKNKQIQEQNVFFEIQQNQSKQVQNTSGQRSCYAAQVLQTNSYTLYENLKQLCEQRPSERMLTIQGSNYSKIYKNAVPFDNTNKNQNDMSCEQMNCQSSTAQKSPNFKIMKRLNSVLKRKESNPKELFYENLYLKTIKSIERQSKILNYVKNHCKTLETETSFVKKKLTSLPAQGKQNLLTLQVAERSQQGKIFKLKKNKAEDKYLKHLKNPKNTKTITKGI